MQNVKLKHCGGLAEGKFECKTHLLFFTEKWIGSVKFFVSFVCVFSICVLTNFCTDNFGCVVANLCVKLTNCSKEAFLLPIN